MFIFCHGMKAPIKQKSCRWSPSIVPRSSVQNNQTAIANHSKRSVRQIERQHCPDPLLPSRWKFCLAFRFAMKTQVPVTPRIRRKLPVAHDLHALPHFQRYSWGLYAWRWLLWAEACIHSLETLFFQSRRVNRSHMQWKSYFSHTSWSDLSALYSYHNDKLWLGWFKSLTSNYICTAESSVL